MVSVVPSQVVKHDRNESLILVASCLEVAILMKSHTETTRQVVVVRHLSLWIVELGWVVLVWNFFPAEWQLAIGTFVRIIICFLVTVPLDTLEWWLLEKWIAFGTQVTHRFHEYLDNICAYIIFISLKSWNFNTVRKFDSPPTTRWFLLLVFLSVLALALEPDANRFKVSIDHNWYSVRALKVLK